MKTLRVLVLLVAVLPAAAQAQRWKEIGKTSTGNAVFVDPASVVKRDSIITATVRVVYAKPVETPKGAINGSRAIAMFDCARKMVAVKESWIYHDIAKGTIYEHRKPRIPGYSTVFQSNFSGAALTYLCAPPPARPAR